MFNKILYLKSIGFFSLIRIFYLKFIRNILGVEKIFFKTVYKTNYPILNGMIKVHHYLLKNILQNGV